MRHQSILGMVGTPWTLPVLAGLPGPLPLSPARRRLADSAPAPGRAPGSGGPREDWARVRAAGLIAVDTARDNLPFSDYHASFQPGVFPIALMAEVGRRMGAQAQFVEYARKDSSGARSRGRWTGLSPPSLSRRSARPASIFPASTTLA